MAEAAQDVIAVVPARKGSKGLPGKNIRPLLGRPLVEWSISQALASNEISLVHVSTDCETTAAIARSAGADVPVLRPAHLATDDATSISVVEHVLGHYREQGREFGFVVLVEPTSPLRRSSDLDMAVRLLKEHSADFDSLVTLGPVATHPALMKRLDGLRVLPITPDADPSARRQDLPETYFPFGVAYVVKVNTLLTERTFYAARCMGMRLDRFQSHEIDDEYDFLCVEAIMRDMESRSC
ncbi:MAG: acylneuraminate cytidylyltransferase family protein [Actinomycetota bacterium]|nr:acylneuraminate cytidylyltransferase family protein [Actinomycetota bacterium]